MNVSFPAVHRGGLLGLSAGQWAGCAVALAVFTVGMFTIRSIPELLVVLFVSAGTATVGLWPVNGLTPAEWSARAGRTHVRRTTGRHAWLSPAPVADGAPRHFANVTLLETTVRGAPTGVLTDGRGPKLTYSTVLAVEGTSFGLASQDDRERRIGQWSALVASLGESLVARIQVIARVVPADPAALATYHDTHVTASADAAWDAGYRSLLAEVPTANVDTDLAVAVTVDFRKRGTSAEVKRLGGGETGRLALIATETERLWEHLSAADITVTGALDPAALALRVRATLDPFHEEVDGMWPSAVVDRWATSQADGAVHASFWVSGWPQRPVEAGSFLTPLLLRSSKAGHVRTFSLVIEPASGEAALRRVESTRMAQEIENAARGAKGWAMTVRRQKHVDRLVEREVELNEGHTDCRYLGAVTVSAANDDGLAAGVAELRSAAYKSHLRLRRQYGYQTGMLGMVLPLGRGFERKRLGS